MTTSTEVRGLHITELRKRTDAIAQRHLALRNAGTDMVLGALQTLGHTYRGSSGWWITAYATPGHTLGLVNNAKGFAVLTDLRLDAAIVEALTVPDQRPGPQASGAAAWTSPDVGEAHHASAPTDWVQLLVDLRVSARGEPYSPERSTLPPAVSCRARVVRWGLATCYGGEIGKPGYDTLDPGAEGKRLPIEEWPCGDRDIRREMRNAGEAWLGDVMGSLSRLAGANLSPHTEMPTAQMLGEMAQAARSPLDTSFPYKNMTDADHLVFHALGGVTETALREHGVTYISRGCERSTVMGCRYIDVIAALVNRILCAALTPIAGTLVAQITPFMASPSFSSWSSIGKFALVEALGKTATAIVDQVLREVDVRAIEGKLIDIYYTNGPVVVDLPWMKKALP